MKKTKKLFGIIAIIAIIGLLFAGCDDGGGDDSGNGMLPQGNLPAPNGVKAETLSESSIEVSWEPVQGAMMYNIYLYFSSNASNNDYKDKDFTISPSANSIKFNGLSGGATYYFRVAAFDSSGEGRFSATVSAKTWPGPLGRPKGLTATAQSKTEIQLSWDPVHGADGYIIEQSTSSSFPSSPVQYTSSSASYKVTDLSAGTLYYFRVRAYVKDDDSKKSINSLSAYTSTFFDISSAGTPTPLTMSQWTEDSITTSAGEKWYSFDVIKDTTYYIWWDDSDNSSNTLNARSSAFYSNGSVIFNNVNAGSISSESFKAVSNATVYVRVYPSSASTGTFRIAYNTNSTRPTAGFIPENPLLLTAGTWTNGEITPSSGEAWYKLNVSATTHHFWWNDKGQGNGEKTLDVNVNAYRINETSVFNNIDSAWSSPRSVSSLTVDEVIYIRVSPKTAGETGTFGITFNNDSSTRPLIPPVSPTALKDGIWTDGSINTDGAESYYSFDATSGTTYYIWWNENGINNSFKTSYVDVSVFSSDGAILLQNTDYAWFTSQTITPTENGVIFIRVSSSYVGTFGVVYSTTNVRPVVTMPASTLLEDKKWTDGSIATGGEQWFKFTATAATQYIHFTWGALNQITVNVYDNVGNPVGSQSTTLSDSNRSTNREVTAGNEYYIRVAPSSNEKGTFKIAFNDKNIMFGSDTTSLTAGTWEAGYIDAGGEQWFSFTATAATHYIHFTSGTLDSLYVQLYDSNLNILVSNTQLSSYNKNLLCTVEVGKTYYTKVILSSTLASGSYYFVFNNSTTAPAAP